MAEKLWCCYAPPPPFSDEDKGLGAEVFGERFNAGVEFY